MEAKELRIGNLIEVKNNIEEVVMIDEMSIAYGIRSESLIDNLKPIPLTEEWLLNFDFEKDFEKDLTNHTNYYKTPHMWCYEGFGNKYIVYGQYGLITSVKYVHQLQNLYFALTGEELTF